MAALKPAFLAFACSCLAAVNPAQASRLAGERSLSNTPYGYALVSQPVRAGNRAQMFEVRAGDCAKDPGWSDCDNDRERSDFRVAKGLPYGKETWIGFSVYLPQDFYVSNSVNTTVGQVHQKGGPSGTARGLPSFPPLLQLEMRGKTYSAGVHILSGSSTDVRDQVKYFTLASLSGMRGKWTDIAIHLDTSSGTQLLEILVNGKRKAKIADFIQFVPREYYFKYGIYRSFVSKEKRPMPTQTLMIDEVKFGARFDQVAPDPAKPVD